MPRTLTLRMVSGLPATEVRAQLTRARRLHDAGKRALAFYLYEMQTRGFTKSLATSRRRTTRSLASG